jgi:FkbM family methyltransferase
MNGIYFEAGAYNGRDYSNSLFYADNLGWRGLLVEGNEAHITALKNNRPKSIIENCIISDSAKPVNFAVVDCDGWSGILSSFAGGHKQRIQEHNFKTKLFQARAVGINDLLEKHKLFDIDYFSLDVEGHEHNILSAIDFKKFNIKIIEVENQYNDNRIETWLKYNAYRFIKRLDINDVYIKKGCEYASAV